MHFLIPGVTIANQAKVSLDLIYFLNKRFFNLFIFEIDFVLNIEQINVFLLFLELKLNRKEGTDNGKTHLLIFIKFIKKKNSGITDEKQYIKAV